MADRYYHIIDEGIPKTGEMSNRDLQIALSSALEEVSFALRHLDARNFTREGARSVVALAQEEEEE